MKHLGLKLRYIFYPLFEESRLEKYFSLFSILLCVLLFTSLMETLSATFPITDVGSLESKVNPIILLSITITFLTVTLNIVIGKISEAESALGEQAINFLTRYTPIKKVLTLLTILVIYQVLSIAVFLLSENPLKANWGLIMSLALFLMTAIFAIPAFVFVATKPFSESNLDKLIFQVTDEDCKRFDMPDIFSEHAYHYVKSNNIQTLYRIILHLLENKQEAFAKDLFLKLNKRVVSLMNSKDSRSLLSRAAFIKSTYNYFTNQHLNDYHERIIFDSILQNFNLHFDECLKRDDAGILIPQKRYSDSGEENENNKLYQSHYWCYWNNFSYPNNVLELLFSKTLSSNSRETLYPIRVIADRMKDQKFCKWYDDFFMNYFSTLYKADFHNAVSSIGDLLEHSGLEYRLKEPTEDYWKNYEQLFTWYLFLIRGSLINDPAIDLPYLNLPLYTLGCRFTEKDPPIQVKRIFSYIISSARDISLLKSPVTERIVFVDFNISILFKNASEHYEELHCKSFINLILQWLDEILSSFNKEEILKFYSYHHTIENVSRETKKLLAKYPKEKELRKRAAKVLKYSQTKSNRIFRYDYIEYTE